MNNIKLAPLYTKNLPKERYNDAFLFTENAQAFCATHPNIDDSWIEDGFLKGNEVKTGVSDMRGNNQSGIRASSYNTYGNTNIYKNTYGIIVKKYQQNKKSDKFLTYEGLFKNTDSDFELFKKLNLISFDELNSTNYENIYFPGGISCRKSSLHKHFAEWLSNELLRRYNVKYSIEENHNNTYGGYSLIFTI